MLITFTFLRSFHSILVGVSIHAWIARRFECLFTLLSNKQFDSGDQTHSVRSFALGCLVRGASCSWSNWHLLLFVSIIPTKRVSPANIDHPRIPIPGVYTVWFLPRGYDIVVFDTVQYMGVSKNSGTPRSSILIGFSILFTIHFGGRRPYFWKHPYTKLSKTRLTVRDVSPKKMPRVDVEP